MGERWDDLMLSLRDSSLRQPRTEWLSNIRLLWRLWRTSRRLGIPLKDVVEIEVSALRTELEAVALRAQAIREETDE